MGHAIRGGPDGTHGTDGTNVTKARCALLAPRFQLLNPALTALPALRLGRYGFGPG
jgi:hypothetical protein